MSIFTQRLFQQRRFSSFIIPLFALFMGLGSSQTVLAQIVSNSSFFIDNTPGNTNSTYGGSSGATPNFQGANLSTFDINSPNDLLFNGGSFTYTGPTAPSSATLNFQLYTPSGPTGAPVGGQQSITFPAPTVSGNVYTYNLTNAQISLINLVPSAGTFDIDASFTVNARAGSISEPNRTATFSISGIRPAPTGIGNTNVFINTTGTTTPNTTYRASATSPTSNLPFQGQDLGAYDINTGKLTLNGGNATTFESNGDVVQSARLGYLVVKPAQGGRPGIAFAQSFIALTQFGTPTSSNGGFTRTFANTTALNNLISGLANSGNGTFTVSVTYESVVLRSNGSTYTVRDDNGGNGYTATFSTTGVPILIDTWTGGVSDDWFTPRNWDLGLVPTMNTNVIIPDFGVGNTLPYPNIHAGVMYSYNNTVIDNTNSGVAVCRDIDMQGSSQAQRSLCRLYNGRFEVYGSFSNQFASFRQFDGSTIAFAGSGNQTISGGLFTTVEVSGGGTKNLTTVMTITTAMNFLPNAGLFTTDIFNPDNNFIELANRSVAALNGAQLTGESETGYIRGFVQTTRTSVQANEVDSNGNPDPRTFGNIGATLLFTGTNDPGDVLVTRNTAESYTPLVATTSGSTSRFGIRRIFGVRPSTTQPLVATMTFRYLDSELTNLGPNGNGSVPEPNLALFVSTSGGNQFGFLGSDNLDQTNKILTKAGVRTFATFTLGDKANPLPVSLIGFDAKRVANDALVTWQTASELNNKGFDVQVSTDGKAFRTLGFVESAAPNSASLKSYSYLDVEQNKAGARYYRLRQVDVNGKSTYFAPRIVNFEGKATVSAIAAYPNPFGSADQLHLTLQTAVQGQGLIRITDMTGRVVSQQRVDLNSGANDVTIDRMGDLKNGLYMVNFTLPTGEMKNMKLMKQ